MGGCKHSRGRYGTQNETHEEKNKFMGLPQHKTYTWHDYQTWDDDDHRCELIDGEIFDMSPAPRTSHQRISIKLASAFDRFFQGKRCQPFAAPTDVVLSEHDVVQPDLFVVCDPNQIKETHIEGAPALAVEILSPSTRSIDRVHKIRLYARAGVKEYWIISPEDGSAELFLLNNGKYTLEQSLEAHETLTSPSFPGLKIPLAKIFPPPAPKLELREDAEPYGAAPRKKKPARHPAKK